MESRLRRRREEIHLLEKGGASEDDILVAKAKYHALSDEYAEFSKAFDLPQQRERINIQRSGGVDVSFGKPLEKPEKPVEPPKSPTAKINKNMPAEKSATQPKTNEKAIENSSESGIIKAEEERIRREVIPQQNTDTIAPRQRIHRQGTKEYEDRQIALNAKGEFGPAYVTISDDEILELVNKHKGTGIIKINAKTLAWNNKEVIISNDKVVGVCINNRTGVSVDTSVFKIHYSKKGVHIVPDYPSKKKVK